jgi:DNA-binding transcriptional ArsR family regulator
MLGAMGSVDVAAAARLVGDPVRAAMLDALMDGSARSSGELARRCGVAPSTASGHLSRLTAGRLVVCAVEGRERRYRLASAEVAAALEALARVAPAAEIRSLRAADRTAALRLARTCYDHLAGRLGVGVTDALAARGALVLQEDGYALTAAGDELMSALGVDVAGARAKRRSFALACLDWSERRPHLAGALGAALAEGLIANGWFGRRPNDRALTVTAVGARAMRRELGLDIERMSTA